MSKSQHAENQSYEQISSRLEDIVKQVKVADTSLGEAYDLYDEALDLYDEALDLGFQALDAIQNLEPEAGAQEVVGEDALEQEIDSTDEQGAR